MRAEARALGQALLDHHHQITALKPPGKHIAVRAYTIRYGVLCQRAGLSHLLRMVGSYLGEIAEWCDEEKFPPLNSLAVGESGIPGEGYDGAGGFAAINWDADVQECIRFRGYPQKMP